MVVEHAPEPKGGVAITNKIENIVLNPAGTNGQRFLMVTAAFQVKDAETDALMKEHEAEIRDHMLALLGKKTVEDLTDPLQREPIKKEVLEAVSPMFPKGAILQSSLHAVRRSMTAPRTPNRHVGAALAGRHRPDDAGRRCPSVRRASSPRRSRCSGLRFPPPASRLEERFRTLEAMYGRLVKSFEGWLMGRVRGVVDLKLQSVEQISFGEYVLSLPPSCNSFILDIKDRAGDDAVGEQGVIDIGRELAYYLVDRLFGGGSDPTFSIAP